MKWARLTISKNLMIRNESGQSLVELLVAMGVFTLAVSVVTFLILDAYLADRVSRERMIAIFLAKEGIEATISIRDNNWNDLINGEHGIAIFEQNWIFQGSQDDLSDYLREGTRKIIVEEIDSNRKKVTSQVISRLTETRAQDVTLVTYLTNWAKSSPPYVIQFHYRWRNDDGSQ